MKVLVLGDIHGRLIWDDIIELEKPDRIIFLGDYVSTHENISSEQQIYNLEDILTYKEDSIKEVILLRGNHDLDHIGCFHNKYSGYNSKVAKYMTESKNRFLNDTQWIYIDEELKVIFSHAGISQIWMNNSNISDIHEINNIELFDLFDFTPNNYFDMCGTSTSQPPTWIRPEILCRCNIIGYDQVIGHTPQKEIHKVIESTTGKQTIWLCDALANGCYLIIEDSKFIPKKLSNYDKSKNN